MLPIETISRNDERYPELLRHIHAPPEQLYCRGNLKLLDSECFAVVGTRTVTPYGRDVTTQLVAGLARGGFTIVSGLALGIDAIAHESTLEHDGATIAVLGSGVDDNSIYPRNNFPLAQEILAKDGLIVSEYPLGTHATDFTFPERNRIISGLSVGVLVVEANAKSGALITARHALEQNRDVFAVPGSILSPRSAGPNRLIQRGAKAVCSAQDILDEYGHLPLPAPEHRQVSTSDPAEQKILAILGSRGPSFIDVIIRESGMEASRIIATLSRLELKGYIAELTNGHYRLNP